MHWPVLRAMRHSMAQTMRPVFQNYVIDLGPLGAGTHTLTIGGFFNQKTKNNEEAEVQIEKRAAGARGPHRE